MSEVYDSNASYNLSALQKFLISAIAIILIGMVFYLIIIPYFLNGDSADVSNDFAKTLALGSLLLSMLFGSLSALLAFTYVRSKTNEISSYNSDLKNKLDHLSKLEDAMNAHAIVSITDVKGNISYVNDKFCKISKYSEAELIGQNHKILRSGEHDEAFFNDLWNTISSGRIWNGEVKNRAKGGGYYWVSTTILPSLDKQGNLYQYVSIRTEITKTKDLASKLSVEQKLLMATKENINEAVSVYNKQHQLIVYNQNLDKYFRLSPKSTSDKSHYRLLLEDLYDQGKIHSSIGELTIDEQLDAVSKGVPMTQIYETKDNEVFQVHTNPMPGGGFVSTYTDVTEQKLLEKITRRSQKMEAVGQLSGGIAHDFNNILGIILGNLELLEENFVGKSQEHDWIQNALKGTRRGADITRKLLGFSGKKASEINTLAIRNLVLDLEMLLSRTLTPMIKLETHLNDDIWEVSVDASDFEDAILNLSLNARDAMPKGGKLMIKANNIIIDSDYLLRKPDAKTGEYVVITVSDTGEGMSEQILDHVFEPFFTTKGIGKGTGLGLSMVYGFVERSGGHLDINSLEGKGTSIMMFLPRHVGKSDHSTQLEDNFKFLPDGNETILVVDDEPRLLDTTSYNLNQLGYNVLTASEGVEALNIINDNDEIDLIFCDVIMPNGVDGFQLAKKVIEKNSYQKVLLTSGFHSQLVDYSLEHESLDIMLDKELLKKPYNLSELAVAVRRTLDR
ncbi:MAG: ATP-binding protein [Sneathiella sp.]